MRKIIGSLTALLLAAGLAPGSAVAHGHRTRAYVGGGDVLIVRAACDDDAQLVPGLGGVCANLSHTSGTFDLSIADAHAMKVGALYEIRTPANEVMGDGQFCGSKNNIRIPTVAASKLPLRVLVWLATGSAAAFGCGAAPPGSYAPASSGTVRLHYDS